MIPYPGGKWYGRHQIIPLFPLCLREMVSPFLGGASLELTIAARGCRVHGSDVYEPLVNLYTQALAQPDKLADAVEEYHPTDRDKFSKALEMYRTGVGSALERAANWYALVRSSYSGRIIGYTLGNFSGHRFRFTREMIDALRVFRAPTLTVECLDWREALDKHPNIFAYLDPPYPGISRRLYVNHREFDHTALRDYLDHRKAPWALSLNDSPMTREMYAGFRLEPLAWGRHIGGVNRGQLAEMLVTNY